MVDVLRSVTYKYNSMLLILCTSIHSIWYRYARNKLWRPIRL
jgi:hypothetical protein